MFEVMVAPTLPLLSDAPITAIDFGDKKLFRSQDLTTRILVARKYPNGNHPRILVVVSGFTFTFRFLEFFNSFTFRKVIDHSFINKSELTFFFTLSDHKLDRKLRLFAILSRNFQLIEGVV